jgi:hypothetical protein
MSIGAILGDIAGRTETVAGGTQPDGINAGLRASQMKRNLTR